MEYIEDCIGNKVRVGDEILHVAYLRGDFNKRNIFKVTKICIKILRKLGIQLYKKLI